MTKGELIEALKNWDNDAEIMVKTRNMEYDIESVGEWYDYSGREGTSQPALIVE